MTLRVSGSGSRIVGVVEGELDLSTTAQLTELVDRVVAEACPGELRLVLDLGG